MGFPISLVSTFQRADWIASKFNMSETIYMGDGIYDVLVFEKVAYSIAPQNALENTKKYANHITKSKGGEGAVAEAVIHIYYKLFNLTFDILKIEIPSKSGIWKKQ